MDPTTALTGTVAAYTDLTPMDVIASRMKLVVKGWMKRFAHPNSLNCGVFHHGATVHNEAGTDHSGSWSRVEWRAHGRIVSWIRKRFG